jgi:hypothetical protein
LSHAPLQARRENRWHQNTINSTERPEDLRMMKARGLLLIVLRYSLCVTWLPKSWCKCLRLVSWATFSGGDGNHSL